MSGEIEIGRDKRARQAYSFDDIALVPARRTRDVRDVRVDWQLDAYHVDLPVMASPMDSVMSPETAILVGQLGGIGVLDLEGLWTRYEDPTSALERIRSAAPEQATAVLQDVYRPPVRPELITARLDKIREAGVVVAGRLSPSQTQRHWRTVVGAGVDLLVIRGSVVSAEHVSGSVEPLNLKRFIYELDVPVVVGGVTTYTAALHLMRTGAAGVLVGQGGGASSSVRQVLGLHMPMATAVADVAAARRDYMDESGGRYVHVIADGSVGNSGDVVKAIACGADAVMLGAALARAEEAPGGGYHWGAEARHERLPRGYRSHVGTVGSMEQILTGPSRRADGTLNLMGALRRTLATTGYADVKELQRVEIVVAPYEPS
ncbi:GuaB3 family IMP dehydrogenase-related protein [Actinomyces qiguomingii]|uniref:GuaB3 family IMP dehydrogenase-related protein n=1 Tax=Actinomyces qiguomingii TaxID=2057800 RepID=UPI000CA04E09|nr:GuaB3 family IMP dehydrogenase-related protein [Actinomyces qiguomingii]